MNVFSHTSRFIGQALIASVTLIGFASLANAASVSRIVKYHTTTSITNSAADAALSSGSNLLKIKHSATDVACNLTLTRSGNVSSFSVTDGTIDSSTEFNQVLGAGGHIMVVKKINWCGGLAPNIIGCAPVPGNALVVVRYTASLEGLLWVHEYGHNSGLGHNTGNTRAIMYPSIGSTRQDVNQAECNAFL
jgi:hypothetical protein